MQRLTGVSPASVFPPDSPQITALTMSYFRGVGQISDLPLRKSKTYATMRYSEVQIPVVVK